LGWVSCVVVSSLDRTVRSGLNPFARVCDQPSFWRMAPEEALRYAKKEIRDAEPVLDDPDLYAPLFKNVSQFKR
jgi:hypothetical protein